MGGMFRTDGKFYIICSKIADLLLLSIYWVIGCLPVVTIVASTAALYRAAVQGVRRERGRLTPVFWSAYRANLRQSIPLTLICGMVGAVLVFYLRNLVLLPGGAMDSLFYVVCVGVLSLVYGIYVLWLIPIFSRFELPTGKLSQLVFMVSVRYLLRGVLLLLTCVAIAVLVRVFWPLLAILPGAGALFGTYLVEPVLLRDMPERPESGHDWRYER